MKNFNTKEPCLHVFVEKKLPINKLHINNLIPKTFLNIRTDVIETGLFNETASSSENLFFNNSESNIKLIQKLRSRVRPLQPGLDISSSKVINAGTLGCIVFDNDDNAPYILSNNHVIANRNACDIATSILQPSLLISRYINKADVIAYLSDFVDLTVSSKSKPIYNYADCAIATISPKVTYEKNIYEIGEIKGSTNAILDMPLKKVGRSSGLTEGTVFSINAKTKVSIDKDKNLFIFYKNQILSTPMAEKGDSGSLVVNNLGKAVGLLASANKENSVLNPIDTVLQYLNVHL